MDPSTLIPSHLPPYRTNVADYGFLLSLESIALILQTAHHNSSA
jgi:hypothetical protein